MNFIKVPIKIYRFNGMRAYMSVFSSTYNLFGTYNNPSEVLPIDKSN